ncbi:hypothetical protein B0T25DRAFT_260550 [Lasiosphaeria hispida]|uniref:Uncharacterized protein n=1 Tax=Lasiosphaeria hispida TaxID=260671 RepID=A0AAJ0MCZ6_9PEZI|nr:hypothetical protein B0T25DRAFT_260550 [Lasiosphaeria hispida]
MATTTAVDFPLATTNPYTGGQDQGAGSANAGPGSADDGTLAGASGSSTGNIELSKGGLIAIIVVVVVVGILGIASTALFFIAKKREWTIRETIRRSAKRVVTALTPRRSEFPKSVKDSVGRRGGRMRLDEVPPTPRIKQFDLEKGMGGSASRESSREKRTNFSRK